MTQRLYCSNVIGPPTLGEVERFGFGFKINRSIPFFRKESQIVLPLVLRLDSYLRYFEMTYKNILQKFYEKPRTAIPKSFFICFFTILYDYHIKIYQYLYDHQIFHHLFCIS